MRNYFKMLAMHWTTSNDDHLFAWGADDKQLLFYVDRLERFWKESIDPAATFNRTPPEICWFLLNEENFGRLLNNVGLFSAFDVWKLTRLNNGQFSVLSFGNLDFFDITRVKVQGSPRKTWSRGH